jgi:hypothetical protein
MSYFKPVRAQWVLDAVTRLIDQKLVTVAPLEGA